ncbi:hypothetical protein NQ176_g756 [Zarea fungicola]|uniref:Uncharacterized protein n=1 Tax=Zarea fungicola TaxID=93591 RepID=A0ACC1NWN1_9HYPO|nr:hypothetical protein NQ176_g756 [Lecanicillium fungicola]
MHFFTVFTLVAAGLPSALAFCCHGIAGQPCADGTKSTGCCATASCNVFCCACGGHCRTNSRRSINPAVVVFDRADESGREETAQAFAQADTDNAGNLTVAKYVAYMDGTRGGPEDVWVSMFRKFDRNGDGVLTLDEVDRE